MFVFALACVQTSQLISSHLYALKSNLMIIEPQNIVKQMWTVFYGSLEIEWTASVAIKILEEWLYGSQFPICGAIQHIYMI